MKKYKWNNASEWLMDKVQETDDVGELKSIIYDLLTKVTPDEVQDLFQSNMEKDGYFKPIQS